MKLDVPLIAKPEAKFKGDLGPTRPSSFLTPDPPVIMCGVDAFGRGGLIVERERNPIR